MRQLSPSGALEEGFDGQLYVAAFNGAIWRTDGRMIDGGVNLGLPCSSSACTSQFRRGRTQLFVLTVEAGGGGGSRNISRIGPDGGLQVVLALANPAFPAAADEFLVFVTRISGGEELWAMSDDLDTGQRLAQLNFQPTQLATRGRHAWLWEQRRAMEVVDLLAPTPASVPVTRSDGGQLSSVTTVISLPAGLLVAWGSGGLALVNGATASDLVAQGSTPGASGLRVDGTEAYFHRSAAGRRTLYRTDGTAAGTTAIGSFATTTAITQIDVLGPTPVGPAILVSELNGARLIRVTPTFSTEVVSASPTNLTGLPPFNFSVPVPGGVVYSTSRGGNELSVWDGTDGGVRPAGTGVLLRQGTRAIVKSPTAITSVTPTSATLIMGPDAGSIAFSAASEDELFFATQSGATQTVWTQTEGSAPRAVWTGSAVPQVTAATRLDGRVIIAGPVRAPNGATLSGLISIDATGDAGVLALPSNTSPAITTLASLRGGRRAIGLTSFGGGIGGVWGTDGIDAGQLWTGSILRSIPTPTQIFFAGRAADGGAQASWWRTDGTSAGTIELTRAVPPVDAPLNLITEGLGWVTRDPGDGPFFFAAGDELGNEPWVSDGTLAGTSRVADLAPGPASSNPRNFVRVGDSVFFVATTPQGEALWSVSRSGTPTDGGSTGTGGGSSGTGGGTSATGGGASATGGGTSGAGGGVSGTGGGSSGTGGGGQTAPSGCGCSSLGGPLAALWLAWVLRRVRRG